MKKLFVLLAVFALASCIDVDDFGTYWQKAGIDPALAGHWDAPPDPKQPNEAVYYRFTNETREYRVVENENGQDKNIYRVKTLEAGPYRFFLVAAEKSRMLIRYEVKGDTLSTYSLKDDKAWAFMKEHFPPIKDITMDSGTIGHSLKIKLFSDAVYKMLSGVPNTDVYWDDAAKLTRHQQSEPAIQDEPVKQDLGRQQ